MKLSLLFLISILSLPTTACLNRKESDRRNHRLPAESEELDPAKVSPATTPKAEPQSSPSPQAQQGQENPPPTPSAPPPTVETPLSVPFPDCRQLPIDSGAMIVGDFLRIAARSGTPIADASLRLTCTILVDILSQTFSSLSIIANIKATGSPLLVELTENEIDKSPGEGTWPNRNGKKITISEGSLLVYQDPLNMGRMILVQQFARMIARHGLGAQKSALTAAIETAFAARPSSEDLITNREGLTPVHDAEDYWAYGVESMFNKRRVACAPFEGYIDQLYHVHRKLWNVVSAVFDPQSVPLSRHGKFNSSQRMPAVKVGFAPAHASKGQDEPNPTILYIDKLPLATYGFSSLLGPFDVILVYKNTVSATRGIKAAYDTGELWNRPNLSLPAGPDSQFRNFVVHDVWFDLKSESQGLVVPITGLGDVIIEKVYIVPLDQPMIGSAAASYESSGPLTALPTATQSAYEISGLAPQQQTHTWGATPGGRPQTATACDNLVFQASPTWVESRDFYSQQAELAGLIFLSDGTATADELRQACRATFEFYFQTKTPDAWFKATSAHTRIALVSSAKFGSLPELFNSASTVGGGIAGITLGAIAQPLVAIKLVPGALVQTIKHELAHHFTYVTAPDPSSLRDSIDSAYRNRDTSTFPESKMESSTAQEFWAYAAEAYLSHGTFSSVPTDLQNLIMANFLPPTR